jgi:hypothetical protein
MVDVVDYRAVSLPDLRDDTPYSLSRRLAGMQAVRVVETL